MHFAGLTSGEFWCLATLRLLFSLVQCFIAIPAAPRLIVLSSLSLAHATMSTPFSELGQQHEGLLTFAALLTGELICHPFKLRARVEFADRQLLAALERDNKELKQLTVAKDTFVASLSHEMRTPLNGIMGMLQLAKTRRDPAEIRSFISRSLVACDQLQGLLDDTLDLTRLEQGRAILNVGPLSPPALARNCIELVEPAAARKHIELVLHIEEAVASAGTCEGDARRLTQVLLNLLNNAIKFTPDNGALRPLPGPDPCTANLQGL